jgi:hypothetical protein
MGADLPQRGHAELKERVAMRIARASLALQRVRRIRQACGRPACLKKIDGNWLVVHDQISVPLDFESGKALLNLEP